MNMSMPSFQHLLHRSSDANKYDFGHVLIIGGSPGMVGAPFLAAEASLRIGAGLVTIASEDEVVDKLEERVSEIMTLAIGRYDTAGAEVVKKFIRNRHVTTVVIGPGMSAASLGFVRQLVASVRLPLVVDAGGLAAFTDDPAALRMASEQNPYIIVTPHTGEFGRLSGSEPTLSPAKMQSPAVNYAKNYGVTVILKGWHTLIAYPDGTLYENQTGNPGMATAGSGDVLAGIVVGLLAQGYDVKDATKAAVYIHGLAGDIAVKDKTEPGIIASDIIDYLPQALKTLH